MNRRADIDAAKGLAILLVVFGHLVARADPAGVHWYEPLRRAIYAFHMPFFLYLSGVVAALSGAAFTPPARWAALARSRAERLLVPFFLLGLLIVTGKIVAKQFVYVDNAPAGLREGLSSLVWHTAASPALSIWYLFVLFVLSLACPLFLKDRPSRLPGLLLVAAILYVLPLPPFIYTDRVGRYAIFFVIGVFAGRSDAVWTATMDRVWLPALAVLLGVCLSIAGYGANWPPALTLLPAGLLAMPALHGLVRQVPSETLRRLGRHAFVIYLLNTICIGLAKGVLLRVVSWNGAHFAAFAVVLMAAGVLGPIGVKRLLPARGRLHRLMS